MNARFAGSVTSVVNGVVAFALVVLVAAAALTWRAAPPPGISAFAPQAAKPITRAPLGQSAEHGSEPGSSSCTSAGCAPITPRATPVPLPTPSAGTIASALQCYEWPDGSVTQTFDPQSPPCIASWPGAHAGNGGATTRGVGQSTIRVAVPQDPDPATEQAKDELQPIVDFLNARFQLYGRKLVLVPFTAAGGGFEPSNDAADAATAASLRPFASLDYSANTNWGLGSGYMLGTAAKRIVTMNSGRTYATSRELERGAPYLWAYAPMWDQLQRATGSLICRQLAGRVASYSSQFGSAKRMFAVLVPKVSVRPATTDLDAQLRACGVQAHTHEYEVSDTNQFQANQALMVQLRNAGVTSIVYVAYHCCIPNVPMHAAENVGYRPEWIIPGQKQDDSETTWSMAAPPAQASQVLGLAPWNRKLPPTHRPVVQVYATQGRQDVVSRSSHPLALEDAYHELLLLASGVQAAGPDLTPESFSKGLHQLAFPNPGAGTQPSFQARVGFEDGDHVMTQDYALVWWNPGARGDTPTGAGAFCYAEGARRWRPERFPTQASFFRSSSSAC